MDKPFKECVLYNALKNNGQKIPMGPKDAVDLFLAAGEQMRCNDVVKFYDPVPRCKIGEAYEYGGMKPPFPTMWIELSGVDGIRMGNLVTSGPSQFHPDKTAVHIFTWMMRQDSDKHPIAMGGAQFMVDEHGNGKYNSPLPLLLKPLSNGHDNYEVAQNATWPAIKTIQLANALNVGYFEVRSPDETAPYQSRAFRRAAIGRRYYVLTIRPKQYIRSGVKIVQEMGVMPLHTARGHFQHYGPAHVHGHPDGKDRGLAFGWLAGRWWIDAVGKGKAENGVIEKDYKIHPDARQPCKPLIPSVADIMAVPPVSVMFQRQEQR